MGCSSSKNVVSPTVTNNNVMKDVEINNHTGVVHSPRKGGHIKTSDKKPSPTVPVKLPANNEVAKASVAFDVSLDGTKMDKNSLIMKHPPKKFQRLEPLNHPVFSSEMLLEKQRQAEEKRKAALQKKREVSQKTSRRRRDLVRAREFEEKQSSQQIDEQLKAAEKMRAARQRTIVERQQLREERAKRVRRKAKKLNDPDELEIPDIEADETYLDDDDSFTWDDGVESYYGDVSSVDPVKRAQNNPRHITSASTIDSVDNAFLNKPHSASLSHTNKIQHDDFFDT